VATSTGTLAAGQVVTLYDVNVIEQLAVTAFTPTAAGGVLTVISNFQAIPTPDCAWAYGQSAGFQPAKLFRITQMKKSGDFNFQINALEYNGAVYTDVTPNYGEIVGVPDGSPAIANLSLTEQFQSGALTGSVDTALVAVGWTNLNTAVGAKVEVQADGGNWNVISNQPGNGCTFVGYIGTTYNVRATAFAWQGNLRGTPLTGSITVVASGNAPGNVSNFVGIVTGSNVTFTWDAASGADHYEIRYAPTATLATWLAAQVLWDGTATTWTTAVASGPYMIVAVGPSSTGSATSLVPAIWIAASGAGGTFNPTDLQAGQAFDATLGAVTWVVAGKRVSITIGCAAQSLARMDGSSLAVSAQNQTFSLADLLASDGSGLTFYFYPYCDRGTGQMIIPAPVTAPSPALAAIANSSLNYPGPVIDVTP
jgi:hypothetical protein